MTPQYRTYRVSSGYLSRWWLESPATGNVVVEIPYLAPQRTRAISTSQMQMSIQDRVLSTLFWTPIQLDECVKEAKLFARSFFLDPVDAISEGNIGPALLVH